MVSLTRSKNNATNTVVDGIRPVNLRTDLAELADLIELVFADSMDSSGRAALREMRYLSKMGPGLSLFSRLNDVTSGINLGYVWMADGKLIGNVSVYPTNMPSEFGKQWIIANVGVHPDYQGRGIARRLMHESMDMIHKRNGDAAILQVDINNSVARHIYRSLGFVEERVWTTWRRSSFSQQTSADSAADFHITRRGRNEWRNEMALAEQVRPQSQGGLGWLRPLHISYFKKSWMGKLADFMNLRKTERLVIRDESGELGASLWIENAISTRTHLTLLVAPRYAGIYDDALLSTAVRRFGRSPMSIEHPSDEVATSQALERHRFTRQRTLVHMRWNAR